jgi:general secretion pathway protein D
MMTTEKRVALFWVVAVSLVFAWGCASGPQGAVQEEPAAVAATEQEEAAAAPESLAEGVPTEEVPSEQEEVEIAQVEEVEEEGTEEAGEGEEEEPPPTPVIPSPPSVTPPEEEERVSLDFDNADIYEVINALGDIIGVNYIIDPTVKGSVNIHTSGPIPKKDIFAILETIFEVNNIAAVKVGDIYKIVPVRDAQKGPLTPEVGREMGEIRSSDRMVMQIVPLQYIPTAEMMKILKPFQGKGGNIADHPQRNLLVITDVAANVKKLLKLIETVDVDTFERMGVRFYECNNSEAKDMAKDLEAIFAAMGIGKGGKVQGCTFIPIERLNYVLAVSAIPGIFENIEEWVEQLDVVKTEMEEQVFIYFVENGKAEEIADILEKVHADVEERRPAQPTRRTPRDRRTRRTPQQQAREAQGAGLVSGEVKIISDETTNAIVIRATPQDYALILKTIKMLDIIPKQVLIEVLFVEIQLTEDTQFGFEWSLAGDYASLGGYKGLDRRQLDLGLGGLNLDISEPIQGFTGFTYAFTSEDFVAFLRAFARENEVNVLSAPHILAADNKEAKIEIGEEVPIVTSEYAPETIERGEARSRNIEYRDTGIIVTVTPRINDKGLVAMDVSQEVSEVSDEVIEGIASPRIRKRETQTSLVVQDGRTIVIGGLMEDKADRTEEGVPFLSKIPLINRLFTSYSGSSKKTELMILITPRVVASVEEADIVTEEFRGKVESLKRLLDAREG